MTVEEKIENGYYHNKKPYESRKKNQKIFEEYTEESHRLHNEFKKDIKAYVESILGSISDKQFQKLFNLAWQEAHSDGLRNVLYWIDELIEILNEG